MKTLIFVSGNQYCQSFEIFGGIKNSLLYMLWLSITLIQGLFGVHLIVDHRITAWILVITGVLSCPSVSSKESVFNFSLLLFLL